LYYKPNITVRQRCYWDIYFDQGEGFYGTAFIFVGSHCHPAGDWFLPQVLSTVGRKKYQDIFHAAQAQSGSSEAEII